ncbi:MAG: WS/DGAT domain-containing protein, partial [Pseudomonadota bacterium]
YMDGISLSRVVMQALSEKPERQPEVAWLPSPRDDLAGRRRSILAQFGDALRRAGRSVLIGPALAKILTKHGLRLLNLSGRELPVPFTAPRTAFNTPLTQARSIGVADLPLARLRSIARHAGVTVNDVLLELCDAGMTRYLEDMHVAPAKPLVAQMPISLREVSGGRGNQITIALLELGSDEPDPVRRLQRIHRHTNDVKREFAGMPAEAAELYTVLLQSIAQFGELTGLDRFAPPLGNVVISNVIGAERPLYLDGAPLRAVYPVSTIAPGLAVNITAYTYNDNLHVGIVAGASAIPDPASLIAHLKAALRDLERGMGIAPPPRKPGKQTKPAHAAAKSGGTRARSRQRAGDKGAQQ